MMKNLLLLIVLFTAVISCEEPSVASVDGFITTSLSNTQTISGTSLAFNRTFTVETNAKWSISDIQEDWITVSPISGDAGKHTINVKVEENETTFDREIKFMITANDEKVTNGSVSQEIIIMQDKLNVWNISGLPQAPFSTEPDEFTVTIMQNIGEPVVTMNEDAKSWLTVTHFTKTKNTNESKIKFNIARNELFVSRQAEVTIQSGNHKRTFFVNQNAVGSMSVTGFPIGVYSVNGGEFEIEVSENKGAPSVVIDQSAREWLDIVPVSTYNGLTITKFRFKVSQNTATSQRSGTITITSGTDIQRFTLVQQEFTSTIRLENPSDANILLPFNTGSKRIAFITNSNWTIEVSGDVWEFNISRHNGPAGVNADITVSPKNQNFAQRAKSLNIIIRAGSSSIVVKYAQYHRYLELTANGSRFMVYDRNVGDNVPSAASSPIALNWTNNGNYSQAANPENFKFKGDYFIFYSKSPYVFTARSACNYFVGNDWHLPNKVQTETMANAMHSSYNGHFINNAAGTPTYFPQTGYSSSGDEGKQNEKSFNYWTTEGDLFEGGKAWSMSGNTLSNYKIFMEKNIVHVAYVVRCVKAI